MITVRCKVNHTGLIVLACAAMAGACADAYLQANLACVQNAATRAQADACRSKLHDSSAGADGQTDASRPTASRGADAKTTIATSSAISTNPDAAPTVVKTSAVDGGTTAASLQVSVIVPGDGGIPTKVDATLTNKTKPGFFSKLFGKKDGGK